MTDTIEVVEEVTSVVEVVDVGPQGPASGPESDPVAVPMIEQEAIDRAAADESLQSQLDGFDIDPAQIAAAIAADPDLAGQIVSAVSDVATDSEVASAIAAAIAAHAAGDASDAELAAAVATLNAALGGKQAASAELTAIAALSTTTFGRSLLTTANAAAVRSAIGARSLIEPDLPSGAIAQTLSRQAIYANVNGSIASGNLYVAGSVVIPAGVTPTSITFVTTGTGATSPTHQWFCLIDRSSLAVVGKTANDTTTAWAAHAAKTLALTSAPTPTVDTAYYVGICVVASGMPSPAAVNGPPQGVENVAPMAFGRSTTGLTTPASLGATAAALTYIGTPFYAYVS